MKVKRWEFIYDEHNPRGQKSIDKKELNVAARK